MKAKDYRIGNLVYYHIEDSMDERKEYDEINPIDYDDLRCFETYEDNSEYRPIPLTEEWLLKFGFELKDKVNMGFCKQINYPHMKNYLYANSKYYTTALWDDKKQFEIFIMNQCKFVHQLQNLYWCLCGEELTLKD